MEIKDRLAFHLMASTDATIGSISSSTADEGEIVDSTPHTPMYNLCVSLCNETLEFRRIHGKQQIEEVEQVCERLFDQFVTEEFITLMHQNATLGQGEAQLCTFQTNELFENYLIRFLMFGPAKDSGRGKGAAFFKSHGSISLFDRLKLHFHPMEVHHKYYKKSGTNVITVRWA